MVMKINSSEFNRYWSIPDYILPDKISYSVLESKHISGNEKRIKSCQQVGGYHKRKGHHKEKIFNDKYNPNWNGKISTKAEADCQIEENHPILDTLLSKGIINSKNQRNTSNKSGHSIQLILGNINELSGEDNLNVINNPEKFKKILEKYMKKIESNIPADLLVYDTNYSRLFFNMDHIINYMVENCKLRKLDTGRIKGDFKDDSNKGQSQYFTYEYRGRNHKSYFLGFSGGRGKPFIDLLKSKIKFYEDPY